MSEPAAVFPPVPPASLPSSATPSALSPEVRAQMEVLAAQLVTALSQFARLLLSVEKKQPPPPGTSEPVPAPSPSNAAPGGTPAEAP